MLEAQSIRIICYQLIIDYIIAEVHSGHFGRGQAGAVAAVLQLVVVDIGYVSDRITVVIGGIVGVIDSDKGGGILDIYKIVFICTIVDGDIVLAVVLIIVKVVLSVVVIVSSIIVIPGLEICAVSV